MVKNTENSQNYHKPPKTVINHQKRSKVTKNGLNPQKKTPKTAKNCQKPPKMVKDLQKSSKTTKNGQKQPKAVKKKHPN